jgi:hypothetical protein
VLAPRPEDAGQAHHLSRPHVDVEPPDRPATEAANGQRQPARAATLGWPCLPQRRADDQPNQLSVVELPDRRVSGHAAVAKNHDAIGKVHNLVEAMRDKDRLAA